MYRWIYSPHKSYLFLLHKKYLKLMFLKILWRHMWLQGMDDIYLFSSYIFFWALSLINENIFYLTKLCAGRISLTETEFLHIRGRMQSEISFYATSPSLCCYLFLVWLQFDHKHFLRVEAFCSVSLIYHIIIIRTSNLHVCLFIIRLPW